MTSERLTKLQVTIDRAAQCYYYQTPIMSDQAFDSLLEELRTLKPDDHRLTRVGYPVPPDSMLTKFKHTTFVGSLAKAESEQDLIKWTVKSGIDKQDKEIVVCLKADGCTLVLYYLDGDLQRAVTRGGDDGIGEDVTANAVRMIGVPTTLPNTFTGAIRGEAILNIEDWKKVDPDSKSNPRNLGNGTLRRVSGSGAENLRFYAFDIDGIDFRTEYNKLSWLKSTGFTVVHSMVADDIQHAMRIFRNIDDVRQTLQYWIDGVVFKINNLAIQKSLGYKDNRPCGQIVLKFEAEGAQTKLLGVVLTVGHTGAIIPTGILKTVRIGGTDISSVLLNNFDYIADLDLAINDDVVVQKANDIIPQVVSVVDKPINRISILPPEKCPVCGGDVGRRSLSASNDAGRVYECKNKNCDAQASARVKCWIKKLDIQGIGDEVLSALCTTLNVSTPVDLYSLTSEQLSVLIVGKGKLGKKRADGIIAELNKKKTMPLNVFIGSLGVQHLGRRRAQLIMESVPGQMDNISDWRGDKLLGLASVAGIPNIAADMVAGLEAIDDVIGGLLKHVTIEMTVPKPVVEMVGEKFSFVLTGTMSKPRKEIAADIEAKGHVVKDDVSSGVTYLVQADPSSQSSKTKKAAKCGTKVISEEELYEILK